MWHRQTPSGAVESCSPELTVSTLEEKLPTLLEHLAEHTYGIPPSHFRMRLFTHAPGSESHSLPSPPLSRLDASRTVGLGHENAYVRTNSAAAIADAIEHHPQIGHETIDVLQALYQARVRHPHFVFALVMSVY